MKRALIDTNIIIDALNGVPEAFTELLHYQDAAISIISWIELMAGFNPPEFTEIQEFLHQFPVRILPLSWPVAILAASKRSALLRGRPKRNLKLPDAIILATAVSERRLLVTRNDADFDGVQVRMPYQLTNGVVTKVCPFPD